MVLFALLLGAVWGGVWAAFLQFCRLGQFLAARRTWITVVVGVGGDLVIALLVVPWSYWWPLFGVVMMSSVGIIARSVVNEWADERDLIEEIMSDGDENAGPE